MADLDLSKATTTIYMTASSLVGFGAIEEATPATWSFRTSTGNDLELHGQEMTFDAQGHALSGTVSSIAIDVGNNDPQNPDLLITGIDVAATELDDGTPGFWRLLQGNDVITLPVAPSDSGASFIVFGDGIDTYPAFVKGGSDTIHVNGAAASVSGDVIGVVAGKFRGGADQIDGLTTNAAQVLVGDAVSIRAGGKLVGGDDTMVIRSLAGDSRAIGDADTAAGSSDQLAEVAGGDDYIAADAGSFAILIGDVNRQTGNSLVRGGDDRLLGSEQGVRIVGDVNDVGIDRLIGGDDTIWGNGGSDYLVGDAYTVASGGKVVGGNDTFYGGEGDDYIFGDTANGDPTNVSGGNDELHGDEGGDVLHGGGGDDFLDGGAGVDHMVGGDGNDSYVIDDASDIVSEEAGQGIDRVYALVAEITLADNIEILSSLWDGDFSAIGNGLSNTMSANGGDALLDGKGGNDVLIAVEGDDTLLGDDGNDTLLGGAGADMLYGGDGSDTASYAGAVQGVRAALDGSFVGEGDALGDTFASVERLTGSDWRDVLRGDAGANLLGGGGGNDKLQGGDGNDTIIGGAGRDALLGGAGNDRFDYLALTDGGDTVADFGNAAGDNDTLRFDGGAFGGLPAGALAASRFLASAAGVATTAGQRFIYETDTGVLRYDANGSAAGGVTVIATFSGAPILSAADIVII